MFKRAQHLQPFEHIKALELPDHIEVWHYAADGTPSYDTDSPGYSMGDEKDFIHGQAFVLFGCMPGYYISNHQRCSGAYLGKYAHDLKEKVKKYLEPVG